MLPNVLIYAALVLTPSAVLWLVFVLPGLVIKLHRKRQARRTRPSTPPIEQLAADLRRVDRAMRTLPDGVSIVRRRGAQQAYDALLHQACQSLQLPDDLESLPDGLNRELERARVEVELQRAGLVIR